MIIAGDNSLAGFTKERIEIDSNFSTITGDEFIEMNVFGHEGTRVRKTYDYPRNGKCFHILAQ